MKKGTRLSKVNKKIYEKIKIKKDKFMKRFPVTFTIFRLLLALILFFIMISGKKNIYIFIFALAAFLSFFEGFIIKEQSQLRSIVSLLADKLLVDLSVI